MTVALLIWEGGAYDDFTYPAVKLAIGAHLQPVSNNQILGTKTATPRRHTVSRVQLLEDILLRPAIGFILLVRYIDIVDNFVWQGQCCGMAAIIVLHLSKITEAPKALGTHVRSRSISSF